MFMAKLEKLSHLNQPAEILLLLFMVASDHNRHRTEAICLNGSHDTSATVGHLLSDQTTILVGHNVIIVLLSFEDQR